MYYVIGVVIVFGAIAFGIYKIVVSKKAQRLAKEAQAIAKDVQAAASQAVSDIKK